MVQAGLDLEEVAITYAVLPFVTFVVPPLAGRIFSKSLNIARHVAILFTPKVLNNNYFSIEMNFIYKCFTIGLLAGKFNQHKLWI